MGCGGWGQVMLFSFWDVGMREFAEIDVKYP